MSAVKPILFSAPMVRALLDRRKSQTRRALRPQPSRPVFGDGYWYDADACGRDILDGEPPITRYAVGDLLWCREAWAKVGDEPDDIHACPDMRVHTYYRADAVDPELRRWRPSIFMPRWASRLTLEVSEVRVERLQDISEADAPAEGIEKDFAVGLRDVWGWHDYLRGDELPKRYYADPRESFRSLWVSINGADAWEANPFVAALTITVHQVNVDELLRQRAVPA